MTGLIINGITKFGLLFGLATCLVNSGFSDSLYKWIDDDGNVTYQDSPPPSNVNFEEQFYDNPDPIAETVFADKIKSAAEKYPVSLYSVPNCDACDLVRLYLENNLIPFSEKDIQDNLTIQDELKQLTGQLRVPTLVVGDEAIDGYSKQAMKKLLNEKAYPMAEIESGEMDRENLATEQKHEQQQQEEEILEGLSASDLQKLSNSFDEIDAIPNANSDN